MMPPNTKQVASGGHVSHGFWIVSDPEKLPLMLIRSGLRIKEP